jgi:hypothetical protein
LRVPPWQGTLARYLGKVGRGMLIWPYYYVHDTDHECTLCVVIKSNPGDDVFCWSGSMNTQDS